MPINNKLAIKLLSSVIIALFVLNLIANSKGVSVGSAVVISLIIAIVYYHVVFPMFEDLRLFFFKIRSYLFGDATWEGIGKSFRVIDSSNKAWCDSLEEEDELISKETDSKESLHFIKSRDGHADDELVFKLKQKITILPPKIILQCEVYYLHSVREADGEIIESQWIPKGNFQINRHEDLIILTPTKDKNNFFEVYKETSKLVLRITNKMSTDVGSNNIESNQELLLVTTETMFDIEIHYYLIKKNIGSSIAFGTNENDLDKEIPLEQLSGVYKPESILHELKEYWNSQRLFKGLPKFERGGLISKTEFNNIIKELKDQRESEIAAAKNNRSSFIDFLEENGLNPIPAGGNEYSWYAKCPYSGGKHFIMVSTKDDTFGCGYCKTKGNQKVLKAFLASN